MPVAKSEVGEPSMPTTTGAWGDRDRQRVSIVDDSDRAMRVVHQTGADRSQQRARHGALTATAHHNHGGFLGQVNQGGHCRGVLHFARHVRCPARRDGLGGELVGMVDDLARLVLLEVGTVRRCRDV
jgi:hypothetical protein